MDVISSNCERTIKSNEYQYKYSYEGCGDVVSNCDH